MVHTNDLTGDPQFVNPAGDDYHLTSASAARNMGLGSVAVPFDVDKQARPYPTGGAIDIGADEWVLTGDTNADCRVSIADVQDVLKHWGSRDLPYDFDYDDLITIADVQTVANDWRSRCP